MDAMHFNPILHTADRIGLKLSSRACFEPRAAVEFVHFPLSSKCAAWLTAPIKDASPSRHDREEARKDKRELPLHTSHGRAAGQGMPELKYPRGILTRLLYV